MAGHHEAGLPFLTIGETEFLRRPWGWAETCDVPTNCSGRSAPLSLTTYTQRRILENWGKVKIGQALIAQLTTASGQRLSRGSAALVYGHNLPDICADFVVSAGITGDDGLALIHFV